MNVLQMESMLGIGIGIYPFRSGFVHDSFPLLVNNYWPTSIEKKTYGFIWIPIDERAPRWKPSLAMILQDLQRALLICTNARRPNLTKRSALG